MNSALAIIRYSSVSFNAFCPDSAFSENMITSSPFLLPYLPSIPLCISPVLAILNQFDLVVSPEHREGFYFVNQSENLFNRQVSIYMH